MRRLLVLLLLLLCLPAPAAQAALTTTAGQATYLPQDPVRVLDTRDGTGGSIGALGPGVVVDVALPGAPAGAVAAVLTVTAVSASAATNVRVYPTPSDGSYPTVSNLNVVRGVTVANSVTTKLGPGASVRLRNDAGSVHLVADLAGFYVTGGSGSGFTGTTPRRLLDTRSSNAPLQGGVPRVLDVDVPTGATAAVLNVTAVAPSQSTYLSVYPGPAQPTVSNLNPPRGATVAGLVTTKVTSAGTVQLLLGAGTSHVVVDLAGWYLPDSGDAFHPVDPFRVLDTRSSSRVAVGAPYRLVLAGATSLPWVARAVALNVTAVAPTTATYVTVYPYETESPAPPTASNLNAARGAVVPNAVVATTAEGGAVRVAVGSGSVDLVVDVAGWFAPPGDGWDISWPQCTSAGATTSNHPTGGAFAVLGVTHGTFTPNTCLGSEFDWGATLPAPPAVYVNTDANVDNPHWADAGPRAASCSKKEKTSDCGFNYGWNLAAYAAGRIPSTPDGGKPFVWLDVEGPYANGPYWTTSVATNRAVVSAAIQYLRSRGYRAGIYSDRPSSTSPDWVNIMGAYVRTDVQNWVFRAYSETAPSVCGESFSGGPTVMEQISTVQSGQPYDVDHLC